MKLNWPLFVLVAWILFGLELGLRPALRLGPTEIAPSFVVPLLVFIALSAPPGVVSWVAIGLGLVTDLTNIVPTRDAGPPVTIIGPYALGYLLAGQLVISLRSMMIRRNPFTMAFLAIPATALAQIVVVCLFSIRRAYGDPIVWDPLHELIMRMGTAVVTGISGLVLALILNRLGPALGIQVRQQRRFASRT